MQPIVRPLQLIVLLASLIVWPARSAFAEEPKLALETAVAEAMRHNPDIAAARARWQSSTAKIPAASALPDPQVGIEYWGFRQGLNLGDAPERWYDVSQEIPFPGKLAVRGKIARHEAEREEALYATVIRLVVTRAKSAYYQWFLANRSLELVQYHVDLLRRITDVAQAKYAANLRPQLDALRGQLESSKLRNLVLQLEQERQAAQAELNRLLGASADAPLGRTVEPTLEPVAFTYAELTELAQAKRPEIRAAEHEVIHHQLETTAAKLDYAPDLMVQYSRRTFENADDDNIVTFKVNVPLWFWKQGSLVKAAKQATRAAQEELRAVQLETSAGIATYLAKVQATRQMAQVYQTSLLPQSQQAVDAALQGYEAGRVEFLDLLDSQRTWIELQIEYYQQLAMYWQYLAELERFVGEELPVVAQAAQKGAQTP
ncbi:MAG: TolC family protein [Candidatus Omnitrophica bacterium]|nr:TolC family protein [Candidatus Omnitrophota bacterium]